MQPTENVMTLEALNRLVAGLITSPSTRDVWVVAELSDVAVRGGHCYLELLQKDDAGRQVAKARGIIWANLYHSIAHTFKQATGQALASGIKVMLCVTATFHPLFGYSLVINAINPEYTMGDLLRRRQEILRRLAADGILDANRSLEWPEVVQRIAVISAPGAAGYGDFIHQLMSNSACLRFDVRLFQAVMQGDSAPRSIIAALEKIINDDTPWDGVVIIRGGGATSDLAAFEDYDLAASIAQFPIPVIIGIGHERDITVLDYVANMRVKTPTAAAEWLISRGLHLLDMLETVANAIAKTVSDRISGHLQQVAYYEALIPTIPTRIIESDKQKLSTCAVSLTQTITGRVRSEEVKHDAVLPALSVAVRNVIDRQTQRLQSSEKLLAVLSPQATLARGYSLTLVDGKAVRDAAQVPCGTHIVTMLSKGTLHSVTTNKE